MRGSTRVLVVLLTLLTPLVAFAPAVGAELVIEGEMPLRPALPGYPQLSCTIVFERAEKATCDVYSWVGSVNEINVRTTGRITNVHVFAENLDTKTQIAAFDCTSTCSVSLPWTNGNVHMYIIAESWGRATATVSMETDRYGLP